MNPIQSGSIQELARSLMAPVDTNRDGQVSTEEFTSFLSKLLTGIQSQNASYLSTGNVSAGADAAAGAGASVRFEGFDLTRPQDPSRSAKDAFAMAARQAGRMPATKAEAEQWFNQHIRSQMEALGHRIDWVKDDRFQFTNWQGTFVVDFLRGAGGPSPALHWGIE